MGWERGRQAGKWEGAGRQAGGKGRREAKVYYIIDTCDNLPLVHCNMWEYACGTVLLIIMKIGRVHPLFDIPGLWK